MHTIRRYRTLVTYLISHLVNTLHDWIGSLTKKARWSRQTPANSAHSWQEQRVPACCKYFCEVNCWFKLKFLIKLKLPYLRPKDLATIKFLALIYRVARQIFFSNGKFTTMLASHDFQNHYRTWKFVTIDCEQVLDSIVLIYS